MTDSPADAADAPDTKARFISNYINCLTKASIAVKHRRWYVKRLEAFIKAHKGRKIKSLGATDIERYLDMLGRQGRLQGWQFAQCVDAIRILYCELFALPVGRMVDWDYWFDSARQLDFDHPTTVRQFTPEELVYRKERRSEGPMQRVRAEHRELLTRLGSEIRRRGYSYSTDESYEQWVCRYKMFCSNRPPGEARAHEVKSYLDHLAIRRQVSASTQKHSQNALVIL